MSTPIKTGAWLYDEQRGEYSRCDLYEYADTVLIARVNPASVTRDPPNEEGIWVTMHEVEDTFGPMGGTMTYVATHYSIHYMLQFMHGGWHDVKLA